MRVYAGLDNLVKLDGAVKRLLSDVIVHENFTSTEVRDDNDIAIGILDSPVLFGDTIIPICLPKPRKNENIHNLPLSSAFRLHKSEAIRYSGRA